MLNQQYEWFAKFSKSVLYLVGSQTVLLTIAHVHPGKAASKS